MTIISINVTVGNAFHKALNVMAGTSAQITVMKMTVVSIQFGGCTVQLYWTDLTLNYPLHKGMCLKTIGSMNEG